MTEQEEKEWERIQKLNESRFRWGCHSKEEELAFFAEHKGDE